MKVIIAGSREIIDYEVVEEAMSRAFHMGIVPTEVVSGTARGVDRLGERWATSREIPIKYFPADWNSYGKSAGPIRNKSMSEYADALVAIWDGFSKGTKNMIDNARERGLQVYVMYIKDLNVR